MIIYYDKSISYKDLKEQRDMILPLYIACLNLKSCIGQTNLYYVLYL